jgi:hypothetical protein
MTFLKKTNQDLVRTKDKLEMLLFKTSGLTLGAVIYHQKHAFHGQLKRTIPGELILVSKNVKDCRKDEKQIQYIMYLEALRDTSHAEIETYWPGNFGRWKYIVDCYDTTPLQQPFNLHDLLDYNETRVYKNVTPAMKIRPEHEILILNYLRQTGAIH